MTEIEELRAEVAKLREELWSLRITGVNHYHHHAPLQQPTYYPPLHPTYYPNTCGGRAEPVWPNLDSYAKMANQLPLTPFPGAIGILTPYAPHAARANT